MERSPSIKESAANLAADFAEEEEQRDVGYFRRLMDETTKKLEGLCAVWEAKLAGLVDLSEETVGQIRAAVGKARLLCAAKGRMGQFRGLVDDCQFERGDKPTTCMDLQVQFYTGVNK